VEGGSKLLPSGERHKNHVDFPKGNLLLEDATLITPYFPRPASKHALQWPLRREALDMRHCLPAQRTRGSFFAANALLCAVENPHITGHTKHVPKKSCFRTGFLWQTADRRGSLTPKAASTAYMESQRGRHDAAFLANGDRTVYKGLHGMAISMPSVST